MAELISKFVATAELVSKSVAMAEHSGIGGAKWQWRSKMATPQQSGKLAVSSKHTAS